MSMHAPGIILLFYNPCSGVFDMEDVGEIFKDVGAALWEQPRSQLNAALSQRSGIMLNFHVCLYLTIKHQQTQKEYTQNTQRRYHKKNK